MGSFYFTISNGLNEGFVRSIQILEKLQNLKGFTFRKGINGILKVLEDPKNTRNIAFASLLLIVAVILRGDTALRCLNASVVSNTEYCYSLSVSATNSSVSGYSYFDYPLRVNFPIDTWELEGKLDKANSGGGVFRKAWDINAFQGSNSNQFDVVAQNLYSSGGNPVYVVQPFIENNSTTKTFYNIGNNQAKRDQGLYFYRPIDTATIIDCQNGNVPCVTNPIDYTINFKIEVELKPLNSSTDYLSNPTINMAPNENKTMICDTSVANPCYADLVSKFNPSTNQGYRIRIKRNESLGTMYTYLVCQLDSDIQETAFTTFEGKSANVNVLYKAYLDLTGNTQLDCGYTSQGTSSQSNVSSLTSASAGHLLVATQNNDNLLVCNNCSKTMVYDIKFGNKTTNTQNARYMMNANQTNETSSAFPYTSQIDESTGNYVDGNGNDIKLVWSINTTNSANDMTVASTDAVVQSASQMPTQYQDSVSWVPNWYGSGNPIALANPDRPQNSFLYWLYGKPASWDIPDNFYYTMIFLSIGSIFAMMMFMLTREVFIATIILGMPLLFGITQGLVPLWFGFVWLLSVIGVISGKSYFRGI